jgi:agmatine deiminase
VKALDVAVEAARAGAAELRLAAGRELLVEYKGDRTNLVTDADLRSQEAITRVILDAFPDHAVDGEEGRAGAPDATHVWYVDPLDGTTNYTHGMPFFCVSIALRNAVQSDSVQSDAGQTTVGVVYDPVHDEMFTAEKGKGAFLNGQSCTVSGTSSVGRSLIAAQAQTSDPAEIRAFAALVERLMLACVGVRSSGSAALTLCAIACGRLDAYCERSIDAYDILAGQLILQEAGGTLTTLSGAPYDSVSPTSVLASNGLIHADLATALHELLCVVAGLVDRCPARHNPCVTKPDPSTMSSENPAGGPRRMPAEWEPHERAWMAWPTRGYTLGDTAAEAEEARVAWAAVANAVAEREPLSILVTADERDEAIRRLNSGIELLDAELDDAWYRDIGPTFVVEDGPGSGTGSGTAGGTAGSTGSGAGAGTLAAVDWVFNGWGQQDWAAWDHDALAARVAIEASGARRIDSSMVNEGGAIHTDGRGTFLATRSVQLDPLRNPGWSAADVEAELARVLGARHVIWFERGLHRDAQRFGTKGHVDILATFCAPGRVLIHDQRDAGHPDVVVSAELRAVLAEAADAAGQPIEAVALPAPATLRDAEGFVDYSYVNHFVVNGAVIACAFGDPGDDRAAGILADSYPGRDIVTVDARPIFARGGGIHCITQQQPAL